MNVLLNVRTVGMLYVFALFSDSLRHLRLLDRL
jgi:hypothetical protein